jgi:hypothetical protein
MPIYCATNQTLPAISMDYCNPTETGDEITHIAYTVRGKGFQTQPTATNWNDRVSNTEPLPTGTNPPNEDYPIRVLEVKASKPATTYNEKEISLGRKIVTPEETSIEFEIDDVPLTVYNMHLAYQNRNYNPISFWFFTKDREYGPVGGISGTIRTEFILSGDRKGLGKVKGKIIWKSGDPVAQAILPGLDFMPEG